VTPIGRHGLALCASGGTRGTRAPGLRGSTAAPPTRVLYVSPLKALGADVERNLRRPLPKQARWTPLCKWSVVRTLVLIIKQQTKPPQSLPLPLMLPTLSICKGNHHDCFR